MLEQAFGFLTFPVLTILAVIVMVLAVFIFPLRYLLSRIRRGLLETHNDALDAIGMEMAELRNTCAVLKDELQSLKQEKTGITTEEFGKINKDVAHNVELKSIELRNIAGNITESDPISDNSLNSLKREEDGPASIYRELSKLNKNISVAIALLMELRHTSGHTSPKTQCSEGLIGRQTSSMRSTKGDESFSAT